MTSIKEEIQIQKSPADVYAALSTQAGFRGWWNQAGEVDERAGGSAKLHFVKDGMPVEMAFRIDEMATGEKVHWTCTAHDMPSWVGTTLDWRLLGKGTGTVLRFEHAGWKEDAPEPVIQGWKHFLGSLKSYVESGTGQPW